MPNLPAELSLEEQDSESSITTGVFLTADLHKDPDMEEGLIGKLC